MSNNNGNSNLKAFLGSVGLFLGALAFSPIMLWFLMGAAEEVGVSHRLIYQNYSELGYSHGYQLSLWLIMASLLYFIAFLILRAKKRIKTILPWLITGGITVALSLAMVIATIVLYRTTDGTEKFSGTELQVAQSALQSAEERDLGPLHVPWKYKVISVHNAPNISSCMIPQNTNSVHPEHYIVTVEGVWLFGIHETIQQSVCQ